MLTTTTTIFATTHLPSLAACTIQATIIWGETGHTNHNSSLNLEGSDDSNVDSNLNFICLDVYNFIIYVVRIYSNNKNNAIIRYKIFTHNSIWFTVLRQGMIDCAATINLRVNMNNILLNMIVNEYDCWIVISKFIVCYNMIEHDSMRS